MFLLRFDNKVGEMQKLRETETKLDKRIVYILNESNMNIYQNQYVFVEYLESNRTMLNMIRRNSVKIKKF